VAKKTDQIKELARELLEKMGYAPELSVTEDKEGGSFNVAIKTDDPGSLIGFHGRTLSSFQLILGLMVFRKLGGWQRVIVNVNDYRQEQEERLKNIALTAVEKVRLSGRPVALSPMNPFERRQVHIALSGLEEVETISEGEGSFRHVMVVPKGSVGAAAEKDDSAEDVLDRQEQETKEEKITSVDPSSEEAPEE